MLLPQSSLKYRFNLHRNIDDLMPDSDFSELARDIKQERKDRLESPQRSPSMTDQSSYTPPSRRETTKITFNIPDAAHEEVRIFAFRKKVTLQSMMVEALNLYLQDRDADFQVDDPSRPKK